MKIIPSQFQILAKNRHYKMANTSFLFLLLSLQIDRKMTQRIGGEFFFFYGRHLNLVQKSLNKTAKTFFRFGLHLKNWVICIQLLLKTQG